MKQAKVMIQMSESGAAVGSRTAEETDQNAPPAEDVFPRKPDLRGGDTQHDIVRRDIQATQERLLAESTVVFHDKRTASRLLSTQLLVRIVGRLAVVDGAEDIQGVVEKLHVPHSDKGGVNAVITDLDLKVPKLLKFLRSRSLRPGFEKLPIVPVIVVVDADDRRPQMLASALEGGACAILRRPLDESVVAACLGDVLRRHASIEFIYKDVVGEVETFNYPRFVLEGFQFLSGVGEDSPGRGGGGGSMDEAMGDTVRNYTRPKSESLTGIDPVAVGSIGWVGDIAPTFKLETLGGAPDLSNSSADNKETEIPSITSGDRPQLDQSLKPNTSGEGKDGSGGQQAKAVTGIEGTKYFKLSSPCFRPRLYLSPASPGDKGYAAEKGATTAGRKALGSKASDAQRDHNERQVSQELASFVKRKAPPLRAPTTSSGLDKARLARTMRLVESAFTVTKGKDLGKQYKEHSNAGVPTPEEEHRETLKTDIFVDPKNGLHPGESWRAAPARVPLPDEANPLSPRHVFGASGSQGRRAATRPGIFDQVARGKNRDAEIATEAGAGQASPGVFATSTPPRAGRSILGIYGGESGDLEHQTTATGVVGWTESIACSGRDLDPTQIPTEEKRVELFDASDQNKAGSPSSSKGQASHRQQRCSRSSFRGVSDGEGLFKTVLPSMEEAEASLRAGLNEIKTNPDDVLRYTYVEIKPSRHVSTAIGCHLVRGWEEQNAGHLKRALDHYRRAVASEPESAEALFCKAVVSAQLGELFDALTDFSAAINFTLAELHRCREKKGTMPLARGVGLGVLYFNRALVNVCLGDDASALDDLDRAVAKEARSISYRSNRALILRRVGDFRGAQQDYSRIRSLESMERIDTERCAANAKGSKVGGPRAAPYTTTGRLTTALDSRAADRIDAAAGNRWRAPPEVGLADGKVTVHEEQNLAPLDAWWRAMAVVAEAADKRDETVRIENTLQEEKKEEGPRKSSSVVARPSENCCVKNINTSHHTPAAPETFVEDSGDSDGGRRGVSRGSTDSRVIENRFGTCRWRAAVRGGGGGSGKDLDFPKSGTRKSPHAVGAALRETLITSANTTARVTNVAACAPRKTASGVKITSVGGTPAAASTRTAASARSRGASATTQPLPDTATRPSETISRPRTRPKPSHRPQESTKAARVSGHLDAAWHSPVDSQIAGASGEKWSAQFRDITALENSARREALLQKLVSTKDDGAGPGATSPQDVSSVATRETGEAGGAVVRRSAAGSLRARRQRGSGMGVTLGEFKASIGFSAKEGLFDDLFGKPSYLDEALVAEPGQRTRKQLSHVVQALRDIPALIGLPGTTLTEVAEVVEYRVLDRSASSLLQGEETDAMFVILSGRNRVVETKMLSRAKAPVSPSTSLSISMWDSPRYTRSNDCRIAVKLGGVDQSVVTSDQLGPGDTFGESCMLEELRARRSKARELGELGDTMTALSGEYGEAFEARQELPVGHSSPRKTGEAASATVVAAAAGKSMETYQTVEPTRLMLILKGDFFRISRLFAHCLEAFRRRLHAIRRCGLFAGWDAEDLMQLARMSRVHRHPPKSVLLAQRKESSHLHIVLLGTCIVTKYPDRQGAVQRKISEIGAALYRIKSKYAYHREIRTKIEARVKSNVTPLATAENSNRRADLLREGTLEIAGGDEDASSVPKRLLPRRALGNFDHGGGAESAHTTKTEIRKAELEVEMLRWRRKLALIRRKDGDKVDTSQTYKVATLQHPKFFGEMCLLVPNGGEALGSVSADTFVETVSISKYVLQMFRITDAFLQRIHLKATLYPEDINLAEVINAERSWEGRKRDLVLEALIGPAASTSGRSGSFIREHKNQKLIRSRPKRPITAK